MYAITKGGRRIPIDQSVKKWVPLEVTAPVAKDNEDQAILIKNRRRRAAKTDADWQRRMIDHMSD